MLVCLLLFLITSCKGEAVNALRPRTDEINWVARIKALENVYRREGIRKFLEAKAAFSQDVQEQKCESDATYDLCYYFVDPRLWSCKESESADARLLQALMDEIECAPGVSEHPYWVELENETYIEWTGSGNPYLPPVNKAILQLYKTIATVRSLRP